jgi:hypothetical protein
MGPFVKNSGTGAIFVKASGTGPALVKTYGGNLKG